MIVPAEKNAYLAVFNFHRKIRFATFALYQRKIVTARNKYNYPEMYSGKVENNTRQGNTVKATYTYNGLGQRIMKFDGVTTTYYIYDEAAHLIAEHSGGLPVQETVWLNDTPIATIRNNTIYYVHSDHLNTPRKITDQNKNVRWTWDIASFGATKPNENPNNLGIFQYNLRFPGQIQDAETGLYFNYFRYYDPKIGRYLQSDPIGLAGGSLSLYAYADSNPLSKTDPFGLATFMCSRNLSGLPFRISPLFHQYICIPDGKGGQICGGLGPSSALHMTNTPGVIEYEKTSSPSSCEKTDDDNACIEKCIQDEFKKTPPNYSVDLSNGENCQTWAYSTVSFCRAKCSGKK